MSDPMSDFATLTQILKLQAHACSAMGSTFYGGLLERASEALADNPDFQRAFAPWVGKSVQENFADATPLRWLAALHDTVLASPASPLALAFPAVDRAGVVGAAWPLIVEHMHTDLAASIEFMRHEPQTNEVRRSVVLLPGFLAIAEATGLPMRTLELGASAGLNQLWDRRRYQLGPDMVWGPANASLTLDTEWVGGRPPLDARVSVAARAACDRRPIDLTDPLERRRLRAYLWPDQLDRLARFDAAVAQALAEEVSVDQADAVDWTRAHAAPTPGVATVVFHSVFFQYMPKESQAGLVDTLARYGQEASTAAPLAWLRMEPPLGNPAAMELRLTLWPGGEDRLLANAHPHGARIEWLG
jgi:hypothetical protein